MFRVVEVKSWYVFNDKTYTKAAEGLTEEVALKLSAALNDQEIKNNEILKAKENEIESLKQILPTTV